MTIFIDCDGVLANMVGSLLGSLNIGRTDTLIEGDVVDFDFGKCPKLVAHTDGIKRIMCSEGFVARLDAYLGTGWFLSCLRATGERVVCVTSPFTASKHWAYERHLWLEGYMGFASKDIVQCSDKTLLYHVGDTLIDDALHNISAWPGQSILIARPWNASATCKRYSYEEAVRFLA
jgi:5'(3')-deoxyribonucleotidase